MSCEQDLKDKDIFLSCSVTIFLFAHAHASPIKIFRY